METIFSIEGVAGFETFAVFASENWLKDICAKENKINVAEIFVIRKDLYSVLRLRLRTTPKE